MRRAVRAKFVQNRDLAELLLTTGTAELLEDSATDPFWGVGPNGRGENWLGRVLMEVREELAASGPPWRGLLGAAREWEGTMLSAEAKFGWDCPESPDGVCHYFSKEGKVKLADGRSVRVPANHDATNESQEQPIHGGRLFAKIAPCSKFRILAGALRCFSHRSLTALCNVAP